MFAGRVLSVASAIHLEDALIVNAPKSLFNKNFVLLWQGQFVSQLGSQAFTIAMMFWIMRATESATAMGVIMTLSMTPMLILSAFGGTIADLVSRRRIIIVCDLISGASVLSLAAVMFVRPDDTRLILVWLGFVAAIGGITQSFFRPAITASIPNIVPPDRLGAANSINESSVEISTLIGQGIGGTLFRLLGAPILFLIDGVTYLFSALSEAMIEIPQDLPQDAGKRNWRDGWNRVRADFSGGISYVRQNTGLRNLIFVDAMMNFFAMPFFVLLPFYVEDTLLASPDWFGYLLAAFGAGGIGGYVFAGVVSIPSRVRPAVLIAFLVALSVCMAGLGWVVQPLHAVLLMVVAGFSRGVFQIASLTILQTSTPDAMRGRVFGVLHTVAMSLAPVALVLTGVIADMLDHNTPLMFACCGGALVIITISTAINRPYLAFLGHE